MSLDRIDIAILDSLQKDGRMPNAALAERVGLSQSACSRRLDNLEKSGVIRGYHARLSNAALGHQMTAIVHISLSGQFEKTLSDFEAAVKRCPNILSCHLMSGEYDYILRIAAKDLAGLRAHPQGMADGHAARHQDQLVLRAARGGRPDGDGDEAGTGLNSPWSTDRQAAAFGVQAAWAAGARGQARGRLTVHPRGTPPKGPDLS